MKAQPKLTVDLVPRDQWGSNLSQALKGKRWDTLRKETYRRANNRCEVCGGVGKQHPVDAHEVWEYDASSKMQRLVRLIALCPACHEVKHFGRAVVIGRQNEAAAHLAEVNGWGPAEVRRHVMEAMAEWEARNEIDWTLDLSILREYGVEPPSAEEIAEAAARANQRLPRRER